MSKKLKPIDILRKERHALEKECQESEEYLSEMWTYAHKNIGSLLVNTMTHTVKRKLGFGATTSQIQSDKSAERGFSLASTGGSLTQKIIGVVSFATPLIWDIVQPMLLSMLIRKVKSFFIGSSEKKTKKKKKWKFLPW